MKDQTLTATARSEQSLLKRVGRIIKYCLHGCRLQMKHILNVNRAQKMDFNFCVVMTFLPKRVCNCSHNLKSHCTNTLTYISNSHSKPCNKIFINTDKPFFPC